ncbi:kelch-like protein 5 isoform X3 [Ceratitis capitata]|uniref:kelch-like protein 5 isoform X3 n=1 Tax=Ceratitis capitata TaxID=7213 RepID=UPI000A10DA69|nr:kelch-like protein 5 isoform X3 [Ceratitis capitata]
MTSLLESSHDEIIRNTVENFSKVCNSADFLAIAPALLQKIVTSNKLDIDCELDVFNTLVRWYEHDKENREKWISLLISSLRLNQFDPAFIIQYIKPLPRCEQLVAQALSRINEPTNTLSRNLPEQGKTRSERNCTLLVLNDVKKLKFMLRYDRTLEKWQKCFQFKFVDYSFGLIYHEKALLFIGGRGRGIQRNATVKRLDLETLTWSEMSKMSQRRDDLCVVKLDEKIYAFGGHDGGEPFNTAEMYALKESISFKFFKFFRLLNSFAFSYDIHTNRWQSLQPMSYHRYGAGAIAFDGKIYIFGGLSIHCEPLNSVECFDPMTNNWRECAKMEGARGWPGVTILNGMIYIVGGYNEGWINTVERFEPQSNVWTKISPLNSPRFGVCAITVDSRIWAITGDDKYVAEEYDFEQNKWTEKTPLPAYGIFSSVEVPNQLINKLHTKYYANNRVEMF